jgi:hypothetical protein
MGLMSLLKSLIGLKERDKKSISINTSILPSQGIFYKKDFEIFIKSANIEDINEYELDFIKDDIGVIINKVKKVVENNLIFSNQYSFNDLRSIDIIFIFLEIVKLTKGKPVRLNYIDSLTSKEELIEFGPSTFNYFRIGDDLMGKYDSDNQEFLIDGYRFSLPSIGVENSLTNFLIHKSKLPDAYKYNNYFYDFTYFLGNKNMLSFDEIENLIQIFNFDIEESELIKINKIVKSFLPMQIYSLIKNDRVIEITSSINLEKIWK